MFAQLGAKLAAVHSVVEKFSGIRSRISAGLTVGALTLSGCMPATVPLVGTGPSDPGAKVDAVGYRSTVSPYSSIRPTTPSSWGSQNEPVAPAPKSASRSER